MQKILLCVLLSNLAIWPAHAVLNPLVQPPSVLTGAPAAGPSVGQPAAVAPPPLAGGSVRAEANASNPLMTPAGSSASAPPSVLDNLPVGTRQVLASAEVVLIMGDEAVLRVSSATDTTGSSSAGGLGGQITPVATVATTSTDTALTVAPTVPVREQSLLVQNRVPVFVGLVELIPQVHADMVVLRLPGKKGQVVYVGRVEGTDRDPALAGKPGFQPDTSGYTKSRPTLDNKTTTTGGATK